jgi:4-hydroxy-tetrahydrodipicolinate reductase
MLHVLQIGLGPLGRRISDDLLGRRLGDVAGAVDVDPALVGTEFRGATVTDDLRAAIAAGGFDVAVVTTSSDLERCADTFRALLNAGCAVVSTCEELSWPWLRHAELADELDALAREHGGRLLGTGINPGYLMDALAVFATAPCRTVRRVDTWRIQDATTRRLPFQRKIGATLDRAAFQARVETGALRHVGLGESLHLVAKRLGLGVAKWDETIEPVIAARELSCELGPIPAGNAAGVRQIATAWDGRGEIVVRAEFQAAIGQADPYDRVLVDGDPPIDLRVVGGVHGDVGTSAMVLNSIRPLLDASPGLHTMATIRLPGFDPGDARA